MSAGTQTFCARCDHPMHWKECGRGLTAPCRCRNDESRFDPAPPPSGLDAAWKAAEAALPEGWRFQSLEQWWDPYEGAYFRASARDTTLTAKDIYADDGGGNPSPEAALLALAAALSRVSEP